MNRLSNMPLYTSSAPYSAGGWVRFVILLLLLTQLMGRAAQLHQSMMMDSHAMHMTHQAHAQHHETPVSANHHIIACPFVSSPMLLCALPPMLAGMTTIGRVFLQTPQSRSFVFRVPVPPPK